MKKIFSFVMVLTLMLSVSLPAFAIAESEYILPETNAIPGFELPSTIDDGSEHAPSDEPIILIAPNPNAAKETPCKHCGLYGHSTEEHVCGFCGISGHLDIDCETTCKLHPGEHAAPKCPDFMSDFTDAEADVENSENDFDIAVADDAETVEVAPSEPEKTNNIGIIVHAVAFFAALVLAFILKARSACSEKSERK